MQYWIFYQAGVGGDGFGCMLEHATNVRPADGKLEWRIEYYEGKHGILTRPVKFWPARWANAPLPFRSNKLPSDILLNPVYVDLINQQQHTVIGAHHGYFDLIDCFEYQDIVETDQVKIHLYSDRSERVYQDLLIKRGYPNTLEVLTEYHQKQNQHEHARVAYNMHIDIERIWRDWAYTKSCMDQLNIDLPKSVYDHYLTYIDNL